VLPAITNWKTGTEHIHALELFFEDCDHLIEKWETLNPDGTKTHFEFDLIRKKGNHEWTPIDRNFEERELQPRIRRMAPIAEFETGPSPTL
jgi:hypothetical protein